MVAAAIRAIFAQPSPVHVHDQLEVIAAMLGRQFPKVEAMLREAAEDITAFASFPAGHWKKIWSTKRPPKFLQPPDMLFEVLPLPAHGFGQDCGHDAGLVSDQREYRAGPRPAAA
jgi:hypothetical protein